MLFNQLLIFCIKYIIGEMSSDFIFIKKKGLKSNKNLNGWFLKVN